MDFLRSDIVAKSLKTISVCCIMVLTIFFFAGCTSITYGFTINANGSRMEYIGFALEKSQMDILGIDADDTMQKVDNLINNWWAQYSAGKDTTGVNFSVNQGDSIYSRDVTISYATYEIWAKFVGLNLDDDNTTETQVDTGVYYDKVVIYNGTTDFDNIQSTAIYRALAQYLADTYFNGDMSQIESLFDKVQVNIARVYPAAALVHSNADYIQKDSLYSTHIWTSTLKEANSSLVETPKTMYIYQIQYSADNIRNWYLTGIGASAVFGIILTIVLVTKHKNKVKMQQSIEAITNKNETNNNTDSTSSIDGGNK